MEKEIDTLIRNMKMDEIMADIGAELKQAMGKFNTWPTDPVHAVTVVTEESGELAKGVLHLTYEQHKFDSFEKGLDHVREEAVQTAAMAIRFLISLHDYDFSPSHQHRQGEFDDG